MNMKPRFTLYRRGDVFYCQDTETGKQSSLRTCDKHEAHTILHAKNEAYRQPTLNRQSPAPISPPAIRKAES
jgi:hypothetical protein